MSQNLCEVMWILKKRRGALRQQNLLDFLLKWEEPLMMGLEDLPTTPLSLDPKDCNRLIRKGRRRRRQDFLLPSPSDPKDMYKKPIEYENIKPFCIALCVRHIKGRKTRKFHSENMNGRRKRIPRKPHNWIMDWRVKRDKDI